jgi:hypothetical protein
VECPLRFPCLSGPVCRFRSVRWCSLLWRFGTFVGAHGRVATASRDSCRPSLLGFGCGLHTFLHCSHVVSFQLSIAVVDGLWQCLLAVPCRGQVALLWVPPSPPMVGHLDDGRFLDSCSLLRSLRVPAEFCCPAAVERSSVGRRAWTFHLHPHPGKHINVKTCLGWSLTGFAYMPPTNIGLLHQVVVSKA